MKTAAPIMRSGTAAFNVSRQKQNAREGISRALHSVCGVFPSLSIDRSVGGDRNCRAAQHGDIHDSALATGGHAITARYLGNATVPPSISPVFVQTMTPTNTTPRTPAVSLSVSPSPATLDGSVTFTATVTGSLFTQPTGRVVFYADGRVIGDPAGVALTGAGSITAQATFSTSELAHGTHTITAAYTADSTYRGVASSSTLVVN